MSENKIRKQEILCAPNIFATLMMLILLATNVACNRVHGFGQDVERAGEKTQDAADANLFSRLFSIRQQSFPSQRIVGPILGVGFHS